ncbi:hypothetical protein PENVUL_c062G05681 [Penicillium vulpinum]|uniref:Uncharacterized protein n=1 Tax=Penicillium vulpinum TaxID=29845 RepID=A0A1V6RDT1_9EURO|nr:hypothetical protein PENVUL_c062G05681 [Penicillium vulpinum]
MKPRREPILQNKSKNQKRKLPNGFLFEKQVSSHKTNIEALLGQTIDEEPRQGLVSVNCQILDDKSTSCVRMPAC